LAYKDFWIPLLKFVLLKMYVVEVPMKRNLRTPFRNGTETYSLDCVKK